MTSEVQYLIRKSIFNNIREELPINALTTETHDIVAYIVALFVEKSEEIHLRLGAEAKNLRLKAGNIVTEYINARKNVRSCMHMG